MGCATGRAWGETDGVCELCPAGTAPSEDPDAASCKACLPGTFSRPNGAGEFFECDRCDPGTYAGERSIECEACPEGKADHDLQPSSTCETCPAGKFTSRPKQLVCTDCPTGRTNLGGGRTCDRCPEGWFGYEDGGNCTLCNELVTEHDLVNLQGTWGIYFNQICD